MGHPDRRPSQPDAIIERLGLEPHPERGYFRETYRATSVVQSNTHEHARAASTAIYFLVTASAPATYLHRLRSDEVFHLYDGGPLEIVRLFPDGTWDIARLGMNLKAGERPQIVIPAGTWFGTELAAGRSHCLVGCTVAPGFEFADFELAEGPELEGRYPGAVDRIRRMSRRHRMPGPD
jgi:predicted cupin superfamily sugar epimerase